MEFYSYDNNQNSNLLNFCFSSLMKEKKTTINMWCNTLSNEHFNLEKQGFQETVFNSYFGVVPFYKNKSLIDYEKWHYRFIDSDIF